ncbi:MAG: hypothetical protein AAGF25_03185 [Pseudomonadota bacterium]
MNLFSKILLRASAAAILVFGHVVSVSAQIDNTATVNGTRPNGDPAYSSNPPSDTESVTVITKDARFTANKTVVSTGDDAGETIVYNVTLVNTGNVTLDTLSVTDPGPDFDTIAGTNGGTVSISIDTESIATDGILQVGETIVYEVVYTLSQTDIDNGAGVTDGVDNTATVTADDPDDVEITPTGTLTALTTIPDSSALTLAKEAYDDDFATGGSLIGATPQGLGSLVYYRFTVTNTGNTTISDAEISDDAFSGSGGLGTIALVGGTTSTTPGPAVTQADLAPGETAIFEVAYTVTQTDIDNQ